MKSIKCGIVAVQHRALADVVPPVTVRCAVISRSGNSEGGRMNASTVFSPAMQRVSTLMLGVFQKFLMVAGLVFIAGLIAVQSGRLDLEGPLVQKLLLADADTATDDAESADADEPAVEALPPRLRGAMDYVTRRYKVSTEAVQPIFATAQSVGRELHIDPLLIIAVIGVESGFNPFSQSVFGAQGLMQVVPRFHQDKLPEEHRKSTR